MKTIEQIRRRMNTLESEHDPRIKNVKAKKEYSFLKEVCRYLESRPRPELIQAERQRLMKSAEILDSRFDQWLKNTPRAELSGVDDFRAYYKKITGIKEIEQQLKTLEFILSD